MAHPRPLEEVSHRRFNPLRGNWVVVSPNRSKRPWKGRRDPPSEDKLPIYDKKCYLCPGNTRASGCLNPEYTGVYVFENDFQALSSSIKLGDNSTETASRRSMEGSMLISEPVLGRCYVLSLTHKHDMTFADLDKDGTLNVINAWTDLYQYHLRENKVTSGDKSSAMWVYMHIFENKGLLGGASSIHPHSQIWLASYLPEEPAQELHNMMIYRNNPERRRRHLLLDYVQDEMNARNGIRVVWQNSFFVLICPWWAAWPYEILLLPKRHLRSLLDLTTEEEKICFGDAIRQVGQLYDTLFACSAPYVSCLHQAPLHGSRHQIDSALLHMHFYPPLLGGNVRKFFGGFEMGAETLRDFTPETAAERMRGAVAARKNGTSGSSSNCDPYSENRESRSHFHLSKTCNEPCSSTEDGAKMGRKESNRRRAITRIAALCYFLKGKNTT